MTTIILNQVEPIQTWIFDIEKNSTVESPSDIIANITDSNLFINALPNTVDGSYVILTSGDELYKYIIDTSNLYIPLKVTVYYGTSEFPPSSDNLGQSISLYPSESRHIVIRAKGIYFWVMIPFKKFNINVYENTFGTNFTEYLSESTININNLNYYLFLYNLSSVNINNNVVLKIEYDANI